MAKKKVWASISGSSKPSLAISSDGVRPGLTCAYIEHRDDKVLLCATDSYVLAEIPVSVDLPKDRWNEVVPEVALIREALQALDAGSRFRITKGLLEVDGNPALFPVRTDLTPPAFKTIWPGTYSEDGVPTIAFDPALLGRLANAIGAPGGGTGNGVALKFTTPLRPILVEPLNSNGARGLLMPVRAS